VTQLEQIIFVGHVVVSALANRERNNPPRRQNDEATNKAGTGPVTEESVKKTKAAIIKVVDHQYGA